MDAFEYNQSKLTCAYHTDSIVESLNVVAFASALALVVCQLLDVATWIMMA